MKRIAYLLVMLAVVSLGLFAQFDHATNISRTPKTPSMWPQVAFGADGILHIVWVEMYTSLRTSVLHATFDGKTISAPETISEPGLRNCYFPFIAINNKGDMAVIWGQFNTHWVAFFDSKTQTWDPPVMVGGDGTGNGFLSRPKVALDNDGNIFCYFFGGYKAFSRSRINGVWEPTLQLSAAGLPAKEGGITIDPSGKVWVVYDTKQSGGDYKIAYRTRTKDTPWSGGALAAKLGKSQEQPFIGIGAGTVPYMTYLGNDGREGSNMINLATMDGQSNPAVGVVGPSAYHYPRVVVDSNGAIHIASQFGQGDHGLGIVYFNNASGSWVGTGILPYSQGWPKLPGIAAEAYGNVAVSYDSFVDGVKEAYVTTRYPVEVKHFYPPINLAASITYSGMIGGSPSITYNLSWAPNPDNNDKFIGGYKIYKKMAGGSWEPVLEVSKDTTSYSFAFGPDNPLTQKIQYGIATVTTFGVEGEIASF